MRIGIVGGGVVGRATYAVFSRDHDVVVYDKNPWRSTHSLQSTLNSDLVFVCLPTPQKEGSLGCDLSVITEFFTSITQLHLNGDGPNPYSINFVLRSTVPVGTTKHIAGRDGHGLQVVHSPEFLTARTAISDAMCPSHLVIGTPPGRGITEQKLYDLYSSRFPGVNIIRTTSDKSEFIKLATNGFYAVKIAYFNEINLLCTRLGLNEIHSGWNEILAGVLACGRISHSHTMVPGPDEQYGFGGGCLPKDLAMLIEHFDKDIERDLVTKAAHARNKTDRKRPVKDE